MKDYAMTIHYDERSKYKDRAKRTDHQNAPARIRVKTILVGVLVLSCILPLTFTTIYKNLNGQNILTAIKEISPVAVFICIFLIFGYSFFEGLNMYRALRLAGYRINIFRCWKYAIAGFFYSGITPSSSGGQPMQIYYMYEDGISVSDGLFAVIMQLFGHIGAIVVLGLAGLAAMHGDIVQATGHLRGLIVLGITLNILYFLFLLVILFTKRGINIVSTVLIAIVSRVSRKGSGKPADRIIAVLEQYRGVFEIVKKDRHIIWKVLLTGLVQWACLFGIQAAVYTGLGLSGFGFVKIILLQAVIQISVGFLPVPGSAGLSEGMAFLLYQLMYPLNLLGEGVLLGRCFSMYFVIILYGIIILLIYIIRRYRQ